MTSAQDCTTERYRVWRKSNEVDEGMRKRRMRGGMEKKKKESEKQNAAEKRT